MAEEHKISIVVSVKDNASAGLSVVESNMAAKTGNMGAMLTKLGGVAVAAFGVIAGAVAKGLDSAIKYEDAFAGIKKTVSASEEDFQRISDNIRGLSREMPQSAVELAKIGEIAGQLGIHGVDDLNKFIQVIGKLELATNLTAQEAASSLASITNVMNEPVKDIDKLASTLVYLGNNFNATEKDIISWGKRLSGVGEVAGFTASEILAIGAAGASSGVQAEAGASALQNLFINMQQAASGSTAKIIDNSKAMSKASEKASDLELQIKKAETRMSGFTDKTSAQTRELTKMNLDKYKEDLAGVNSQVEWLKASHGKAAISVNEFAKVMGMSNAEFKKLWDNNPAAAFEKLMTSLAKLNAEGKDITSILADLDQENIRSLRTLMSMSGNVEDLTRALKGQAKAYAENSALDTEFEKRKATAASQIKIFKNNIEDLSISLGNIFLPIFNKILQFVVPILGNLASGFQGVTDSLGKLISGGEIDDLNEKTKDAEKNMSSWYDQFGPVEDGLIRVGSGVMDLEAKMSRLPTAEEVEKKMSPWQKAFDSMKKNLSVINLGPLVDSVRDLLDSLGLKAVNLENVGKFLRGIGDGLTLFISALTNVIIPSLIRVVTMVTTVIKGIGDIATAIQNLDFSGAVVAFQTMRNGVKSQYDQMTIDADQFRLAQGMAHGRTANEVFAFYNKMDMDIRGSFMSMNTGATTQAQNMSTNVSGSFSSMATSASTSMSSISTTATTESTNALTNYSTGLQSTMPLVDTQLSSLSSNASSTMSNMSSKATTESATLMSNYGDGMSKNMSKVDTQMSAIKSSANSTFSSISSNAWSEGSNMITNWLNGIKNAIKNLGGKLASKAREAFGLSEFEHGGIIPGSFGEPVPIIAHAGERIVPRTGADTQGGNSITNNSGGITITFNGPVNMDSGDRVEQLAKLIEMRLGRQNELARYGVGY